jgi:acetyl-CoA carboxylase carboxyl transferase subunit beta
VQGDHCCLNALGFLNILMSKWLKKVKVGLPGSALIKKGVPEGAWVCPSCKKIYNEEEIVKNKFVCDCDFHFRIGSHEYFSLLFDEEYKGLFDEVILPDSFDFQELESYKEKIERTRLKTSLNEAISFAQGKMNKRDIIIGAMDFSFIGGSLGVVMGERISKAFDHASENGFPLIIISRSAGARIMESVTAMMQMVKISAKLSEFKKTQNLFISVLSDPTTGSIAASLAFGGDVNIAEPKALLGYSGPKTVREFHGKDLPKGFQSSEFLLERGFIDLIVHRKKLKKKISKVISLLQD